MKSSLSLTDLREAYEWTCWSGVGEHVAFVCRRTGRVYVRSDEGFDPEELPSDIDDDELYAVVPSKLDLDLGQRLVFAFVAEKAPELLERVESLFRSRGAYGRYKDLLEVEGKLDSWYVFEEQAVDRALSDWCAEEGLELTVDLEQGSSPSQATEGPRASS